VQNDGTPNLVSWKTTIFVPNNYLTNNFLHCEFQPSMFSNSKVSLWEGQFGGGGGGLPKRKTPPPGNQLNLVQTIVSQTTSYIVSFNFLCSAAQKFHLRRDIMGGGVCLQRTLKFGQNDCLTNNSYIMNFNFLC